jgi:hypothetical protein
LVPEIVDPTFPAEMAWQTAIGDTLTALLAWAALIALRTGWSRALLLVWVFNLVGFGDMLHNLFNGIRLEVASHLGSAWFGIAFVVPMMLVIHLLVFFFLLRDRASGAQAP